jgi:hypothetical protein
MLGDDLCWPMHLSWSVLPLSWSMRYQVGGGLKAAWWGLVVQTVTSSENRPSSTPCASCPVCCLLPCRRPSCLRLGTERMLYLGS